LDLLAAVLEHADAAIVACDAEGKIVVRNEAARELMGDGPLPNNHPLFRSLREGALRGVEVAITTDANPGTSLLVSAEPLFDRNRKTIGAVATCAPMLAAFREQNRETEEARKRLELLLESTGEGIYGLDMDGRCTFINGSAVAMLGCGRKDLLGKRMHDMIHHRRPNGQPYAVESCPIYRAFREGVGCRVDDELFFRADGSSFPVEYSAYPIMDAGVVRGAVVTFSDVSARKRTDAALRASEAKYRSLFETVSEGVYQTSANGELLAANQALIEMLGYSSELELRAQDVTDLYVNPEDRKRLTAQLERDGQLVNSELLLKRKDGSVIRVIENARAIQDERKRLIYYEGTLTLSR
jgi:PAS domain S-box-containing protein